MIFMDMSPLVISLEIAVITVFITFFVGVMAAAWVTGWKRCGKWKNVVDSLLSLPLVLPPTVVGFILLIVFGKNSVIGGFLSAVGINVIFTLKGAVIAAVTMSFPIMYRTARGAFEQVDRDLTDVAKTLGMGSREVLFKVMIPLSWKTLASGAILAFARALGEFGATMMVAGNIPGKTRTMSVAVYTAVQSGNRSLAYTWVGIILAMSFVVLIMINFLASKGYRTE